MLELQKANKSGKACTIPKTNSKVDEADVDPSKLCLSIRSLSKLVTMNQAEI